MPNLNPATALSCFTVGALVVLSIILYVVMRALWRIGNK